MEKFKDQLKGVNFQNIAYSDILTHFFVIPYLFFIGFYGAGSSGTVPRSSYRVLYFGSFIFYLYNTFQAWKKSRSIVQLIIHLVVPVLVLFLILFLSTRVKVGVSDILSDLENKKPTFDI